MQNVGVHVHVVGWRNVKLHGRFVIIEKQPLRALRQALAFELEQSLFLKIMDDAEVDQIVALGDIARILRARLGDQALSAQALPA